MSITSQRRPQFITQDDVHDLISRIRLCAEALENLDDTADGTLQTGGDEIDSTLSIPRASPSVNDRYELQTACEELLHAAKGAKDYLVTFSQAHRPVAALQYAVYFRFARFVPLGRDSSISFEDLATSAGVPIQQCQRVVWMLITCFIFQEPTPGFVAHSRYSRLLVDSGMEATVGFLTDETFRAASCLAPAAADWAHSKQRTKAPLNFAFDTDMPMFQYLLQQEPWRARRFRKVMAFFGESGSSSLKHLVQGFGWEHLPPSTTVVDVGGSGGHCMRAICAVNAGLHCIVQDIEAGLGDYSAADTLDGRIEFVVHDFFSAQTIMADIYLLRWILHDYPDDEAVKILQAQASAMNPGARLIVMDSILPRSGEISKCEEKEARLSDIGMWALLNGRERDIDAWMDLFRKADARLTLLNTVTPAGSALSLMELQIVNH